MSAVPRPPKISRRGLGLADLRVRYKAVCRQLEIEMLPQVVAALEAKPGLSAAKADLPPEELRITVPLGYEQVLTICEIIIQVISSTCCAVTIADRSLFWLTQRIGRGAG